MSDHTFHPPKPGRDLPLSVVIGVAFAVGLFIIMAIAQLLGDVEPPEKDILDDVAAYQAPEIEQIIEDEPPPPEEKEPPPELESEPPQLTLDQLDIALNPGTGGSLAGDFSMPTIAASAQNLGSEDFVDFSELDQVPRPLNANLQFPRKLRKKKVNGRIVLLLKLESDGKVIDAEIETSNLPEFDNVVLAQVKDWVFTPPTKQGNPVRAQARLPIPINIR